MPHRLPWQVCGSCHRHVGPEKLPGDVRHVWCIAVAEPQPAADTDANAAALHRCDVQRLRHRLGSEDQVRRLLRIALRRNLPAVYLRPRCQIGLQQRHVGRRALSRLHYRLGRSGLQHVRRIPLWSRLRSVYVHHSQHVQRWSQWRWALQMQRWVVWAKLQQACTAEPQPTAAATAAALTGVVDPGRYRHRRRRRAGGRHAPCSSCAVRVWKRGIIARRRAPAVRGSG